MALAIAGVVLPLVLPFLLAVGGDPSGVPAVSVVGAADLDCPRPPAVRRALAAVRGGDAAAAASGGQGGGGGGGDAWTLALARTTTGMRIDLRDPRGEPRLSRELTVAGRQCDSAAEVVALIIERYFRDLAWAVAVPRVAPSTAGSVAPLTTPSTTPSTTPLTTPLTAPSTSPSTPAALATSTSAPGLRAAAPTDQFFSPGPRLALGAGPGFWTRAGAGLSLVLDARVRVAAPICLGAGVLLPPFRDDENLRGAQGRAHISGVPIMARVAAAGRHGRLGLAVSLEAMLTFERGQSLDIEAPAIESRTVLAMGMGLGAMMALGSRLRLSADVAGYRAVLGRSFAIGGVTDPVLEPPVWQGVFSLRLEWTTLS